jgi:putative tryptophan/tyrosine transport system substrate-binding protein
VRPAHAAKPIRCRVLIAARVLIAVLGSALAVPSPAAEIAVVYPKTAKPYGEVFHRIVEGVEHGAGDANDVLRFELADDSRADELENWLAAHAPAQVITLGYRAYRAYEATPNRQAPIIGALDASPDRFPDATGIGLAPDPGIVFDTLKLLSPNTRRVLVVYNPDRDRWIIDLANEAARERGLRLQAFAAEDIGEASRHYWNILKYANPDTDALWLTLDGVLLDERVNLPVIIEQSWANRMVVFSSRLEHAALGVLFAVYPDPEALGRRLAGLAIARMSGGEDASGIVPLRDVSRALNVRMSSHLGLAVDARQRGAFDLILGMR